MNVLSFLPLSGLPEVTEGCDLSGLLLSALENLAPQRGDLLVLTHKVVSKACGLVTPLAEVTPSPEAEELAAVSGKDPRLAEVILRSCDTTYACDRGILIAERRDGWICCNAGVDASNSGGTDTVVLLPEDCDAQAKAISLALSEALGFPLPVIICDTHGRALRSGTTGIAVGSWGLEPIRRYTGQQDRNGRVLMTTQEAVADELAGGATLVMGQGSEGIPAVLVRGFAYTPADTDSTSLQLPRERQLYQIQGTAFPGKNCP